MASYDDSTSGIVSRYYQGQVYDSSASSTPTKQTGTETGLGQDAFLKMFMAQMTNQNPLNPMDNTEFTAQLAQFSSLEQLTAINKSLEGIGRLEEAFQANQALGYVGKYATVEGNQLVVADGEAGAIGFNLEGTANVSIRLVNTETGGIVVDRTIGTLGAGMHEFVWDGYDDNEQKVSDGIYRVYVTAYDNGGNSVKVSGQQTSGLVTGYEKDSDGTMYLIMGDAAVALSNVLAVRAVPSKSYTGPTKDDVTSLGDTLQSILDKMSPSAEESAEEETETP